VLALAERADSALAGTQHAKVYFANLDARHRNRKGKTTMNNSLVRRAGVFAAGLLGAAGLSAGLIGLGAASASAAPVNAPNANTGKFNCGTLGFGTYVINTGNSHAPVVAWSAAQLTFKDGTGRTGVFQPRAYNFTEGLVASKNGPGSTVCSVTDAAGNPLGTVTGQVTFTH
jgi:hypothetical protein